MENIWTQGKAHDGLPLTADKLDYRDQVSLEFADKLGDLVEPPFQGIKARPQRSHVITGLCLVRSSFEHRIEMTRLPPDRLAPGSGHAVSR
jgi:hypothetical protein